MQVQIEDVSPVEKKLAVEIPWERVRQKLEKAYGDLSRTVQLRGFRKGKVPRSVIEKMFAKQVHMEVAKELVQESFIQAAETHKIEPVAEPIVEDAHIKNGEAFKYSARIEVRTPVDLKDFSGMAVTKRKLTVSDEDLGHALSHKQQQHTEYRAIDRATRQVSSATDVLMLSVKGKVGEFPIDRPEVSIDLSDAEHEPLPGLAKALMGVSLDAADLAIVLDMPADAPQKEIAGQKATLTITIKEAREKIVPKLDDEFAKDAGEPSLDDLKKKLRADLEKTEQEKIDREVREAALKALVEKHQLPIAPALVERGIDAQLERARMSMAMQGIDLDRAGVDLREMRERLRDQATEEIRGQLLLEAIAENEKVEITEAEVEAKVAERAAMLEKPAKKLRAEMDRDGRLDSLRWRLRQEKALDLLVSRATITEGEPVSAEKTPEASK